MREGARAPPGTAALLTAIWDRLAQPSREVDVAGSSDTETLSRTNIWPALRATTHELVAGFWLWDVKDMDEEVAWVKRRPNPMPKPSEIEIRPLFEMAGWR
jgi:hypothetical protein